MTKTTTTYLGYTRREMLDAIRADDEPDILATACDWLAAATGEDVPEAAYSEDSIVEAIEAEDISLLRRA